jgi:hypothetical protein
VDLTDFVVGQLDVVLAATLWTSEVGIALNVGFISSVAIWADYWRVVMLCAHLVALP